MTRIDFIVSLRKQAAVNVKYGRALADRQLAQIARLETITDEQFNSERNIAGKRAAQCMVDEIFGKRG